MLIVNEIFHSIQTEGPFQGTPATFIRLSGCNLQCSFCDTQHEQGRPMSEDYLVSQVNHMLVVITGGEPLLQDIRQLVNRLADRGITIQIETNGTQFIPVEIWTKCTVVCSPKHHDPANIETPYHIHAIKLLVDASTTTTDVEDWLDWCTDYDMELFFQPIGVPDAKQTEANIHRAVELCLRHDIQMSLQWHKLINIP